MSDEPVQEPAPATRRPASKRLSTTGGLAKGPSEAEQRAFRRKLLLGIIVAIVVLALANVFVFFILPHIRGKGGIRIDVAAESAAAFDTAREARGKIGKIEEKVWISGETLSSDDYKTVKAECEVLIDAWDKLSNLVELVRSKHGEDNKEVKEMVLRLYQIKFWILDASDLVDSEGKEGVDAGFFIPMQQALGRWQKAKEEFEGILAKKTELLADPEQKKATRERLNVISKTISEVMEKLSALDDYVLQGLLDPNLSAKEIPELGPMRQEATLAGQLFKTIKETKAEFGE